MRVGLDEILTLIDRIDHSGLTEFFCRDADGEICMSRGNGRAAGEKAEFWRTAEEERQALRRTESRLTEEEREALRRTESRLTEGEREALRRAESRLTEEERQALRRTESRLTEEERQALRRAEGRLTEEEREALRRAESRLTEEERAKARRTESRLAAEKRDELLHEQTAQAEESAALQECSYIESPMVGIFYAAPAEDAEPFVKVGDTVEQGWTVGIIEAMKLMNEIEAECGGTVEEVLVENGQAVEYGQKLFRLSGKKKEN